MIGEGEVTRKTRKTRKIGIRVANDLPPNRTGNPLESHCMDVDQAYVVDGHQRYSSHAFVVCTSFHCPVFEVSDKKLEEGLVVGCSKLV